MIQSMLRKIIVSFISLTLVLVSTPAFAGEDWGWFTGNRYHSKYYVMNVENEGFFYNSCWPAKEADENWKLQVKLSGKKSKWKTVSTATAVFNRFDHPKLRLARTWLECDDPNYPVILVFNWEPPNWQKDYPARMVYGKKNNVQWTGSIVTHPNLRKIKPIYD
jgi:hypothetical protein